MKLIRTWGIVVFFILVLLVFAGWYLLAPRIIASSIESAGSEAVGAKVEVDRVNLGLFPLSVSINRLQVTDPDLPMTNFVEVEQIKFGLDSAALLWKKILIEELVVDGVQLATQRSTSGKLENGRVSEQLISNVTDIEMPDLTEEDIKQLVSKADLITLKRLKDLDQSQKKMQAYWSNALDKEVLEKDILVIKAEFTRLSKRLKSNKMNLLTDRKDWKKLKKSIKKERKNLADLKNQYEKDKTLLSKQIISVKNGPKDDKAAIMSKMGLGNGVAGLSDKFLGPEFTPWISKLLALTDGIVGEDSTSEMNQDISVYSTNKGTKVEFKDHQIFPDVLIKKIIIGGKDASWELDGKGSNLGYFPWLIGKPAKLNLQVKGKNNSGALASFTAHSDWKNKDEMSTKLNSKIQGWPITHVQLMQTDRGAWFVNSGELNASMQGDLTLEEISLNLSLQLNSPNIKSPDNLAGWQKSLTSALNRQKQLSIDVNVSGTLRNPSIKVSSSVEKLFASAIGDTIKDQAKKYSGKITAAISDKVGDLSALDGIMGNFDQWGDQLQGNDDLLKQIKAGL